MCGRMCCSSPSSSSDRKLGGISAFHTPHACPRFWDFDSMPSTLATSSGGKEEDESLAECDFSDTILGYVTEILMEEDMEDKTFMLQDSLDFQASEKSFYDVLGKKYPPSPDHNKPSAIYKNGSYPQDLHFSGNINPNCFSNSTSQVSDTNEELRSICQFNKGVEEASRFLPQQQSLFAGFPSKGRRDDETDAERDKIRKHAAGYEDAPIRSELQDMVLLSLQGQSDDHSEFQRNDWLKKNRRKGRGKGKNGKKMVDLRTLLISCAQVVAADDRNSGTEMLRQIRQHSSPSGDANQRLSHYFADALEARLAGTGSQIYKSLVSKKPPAADILKAYRLYLAACPYRKVTNFIANRTIRTTASNTTKIHVIDFGILFGFQWPTFIQRLSTLSSGGNGIPKLRITGIDFPQPGFRPAENVEETGRRLAAYAEEFGLPFEYKAIAKKWDTISIEELDIRRDEFLVVNSLYRSKNLLDETVLAESPRDIFLNLVRKVNPDLFIHGILNGAYNAPFFATRFREALFYFSAMFDMLETVAPPEDEERMLLEKQVFGRSVLNVIACESWERVERPETYMQWHVRHLRAGFMQVPFQRDVINSAADRIRSHYHKDFVMDEDNQWLLQGWKGRIIAALSAWKPA